VLEIAEGTMLDGLPRTGQALSRLKRLRLSLAVDDFSMDYASLPAPRRFPFTERKGDRR
jgi:EAL domain-containing protein (putative c-di-GMP-specific phosphodiesterase class I)